MLKAAGGIGLLAGIRLPVIGLAAGTGLVLFFIGAVAVTIRASWYKHLPYPLGWHLASSRLQINAGASELIPAALRASLQVFAHT